MPCPYLPDRTERRVVTALGGHDPKGFHDVLSRSGFRRSHNIAYVPACDNCDACVPMRVVCSGFQLSRNHKRIVNANRDLVREECSALGTAEQYRLFGNYQARRHTGGEMSAMTYAEYQALVEETPVDTFVIEYREPEDDRLVAACLADRVGSGLSAVYSFFDPKSPRLSLGTYMILSMIDKAVADGLAFLYLGFWINGCDKMVYKSRFQPVEVYRHNRWLPFDEFIGGTTRNTIMASGKENR